MHERLDSSEDDAAFSKQEPASELLSQPQQVEITSPNTEMSPQELEKIAQLNRAKRFYFGTRRLTQILDFVNDTLLPDADLKAGVLSTVRQEFGVEDETIITKLEAQLDNVSDSRDCPALAGTVSEFLTGHGNVEDYEALLRQRFTESQGFIPLNETFSFYTNGDAVFLHIAPSRTLTQTERSQQLLSGLTGLAAQLANNPDLANIDNVKMISLLVTSRRSAIEQLGFDVKEVEDAAILSAFSVSKGSLLEAEMPKTVFIQQYAHSLPSQPAI